MGKNKTNNVIGPWTPKNGQPSEHVSSIRVCKRNAIKKWPNIGILPTKSVGEAILTVEKSLTFIRKQNRSSSRSGTDEVTDISLVFL